MILQLRSDVREFIDHQVKAGYFPDPEAVVEAAILHMREVGKSQLDEATIAAINDGEARIDGGEGVDLEVVRARWANRLNRLDPETIAAINEGGKQGDRGEGIDLETFRKNLNNRSDKV